jgi:ribosomal protein S18 acetylase RimI-like enzyme
VGRIANRMRAIDRAECEAFGHTAKQALRAGLLTSAKSWTAMVDDQPEAMFGVVETSLIGRQGTVWLLGTDEVYRHGRELVMWGPGMISRLSDSRLTLRNLVSSQNTQAIRLLKRWGFEVADHEQEIGGIMFRAFVKEPV